MPRTASAWLTQGLEALYTRQGEQRELRALDVVIIGTGYGGAIAASRLAGSTDEDGKPVSVCVLERGKEYLPGMFPSTADNLAGHVRFTPVNAKKSGGTRDGLFDIRLSNDMGALVANGVGGGSLINAGVMEIPNADVFDEAWPEALRGGHALAPDWNDVEKVVGSCNKSGDGITIERHKGIPPEGLQKTQAIKKLTPACNEASYRSAHVTIAMEDGPNQDDVILPQCQLCGDCATGCNVGAKNSLDTNLLVSAQQKGAEIYTGSTVLTVTPVQGEFEVEVVHTDPVLAKREARPLIIRSKKVILAAGTFGSTEILMRSRSADFTLSRQLGKRFSGNGDMIAVGFDQSKPVNAIACENTALEQRQVGPTITGVIDMRDCKDNPIIVEEMAVPGAIRRLFEELYTSADLIRSLVTTDSSCHAEGPVDGDPFAVNPRKIEHTSLYAIMGDDEAQGELIANADFDPHSDGGMTIRWPDVGQNSRYLDRIDELRKMMVTAGAGGRLIPNPAWRPFPKEMEYWTGTLRGPLLTVHPLGGCAMGDTVDTGVVNQWGQVFRADRMDREACYEGLVVLDGSIVPSAVGTNPALTIAALSLRSVEHLKKSWGWSSPSLESTQSQPVERPRYAPLETPVRAQPTVMQFSERLRGEVELDVQGRREHYMVDITLFFREKCLANLLASDDPKGTSRRLTVSQKPGPDGDVSAVRIVPIKAWRDIERRHVSGRRRETALEEAAVFTGPITGSLTVMGRGKSHYASRVGRVLWAYLLNRGVRDLWQSRPTSLSWRALFSAQTWKAVHQSIETFLHVASHAGEVRTFDYALDIQSPATLTSEDGLKLPADQTAIRGKKTITYTRRSNPLRQMMEVSLSTFPMMRPTPSPPTLSLVPEFLARKGLPLFRITRQSNEPNALFELASLGGYFARCIVWLHLLSLRAPDSPARTRHNRLPTDLDGLPKRQVTEIQIDRFPEGSDRSPMPIRLTRYPRPDTSKPPVLAIHGYSASGTTFAHPAVKHNLASTLWQAGYDVWVLDMRSSCGMPSALTNFTFEELAATDIPVAINHVVSMTQQDKVNVVAHCMGAAMLSMAILTSSEVESSEPYAYERQRVASRIHRLVLSQVGPVVRLAPDNIFRAYVFSYLKHWLPLDNYQFSPDDGASDQAGTLMDRLLALIPYSDAEFDLENPITPWRRTDFVRARHRMDALYGRTFSLAKLSQAVLDNLDDFFGPLSVDTATQVAHFGRLQTITDHIGQNQFVSRARLTKHWTFPTLSIHGEDNGLADVGTVERMQAILGDAGCAFESEVFEGFGHQDCLIGENVQPIMARITRFLDQGPVARAADTSPTTTKSTRTWTVQPPWSGPTMGPCVPLGSGRRQVSLSFGANPAFTHPRYVIAIALSVSEEGLSICRLLGEANHVPAIMVSKAPAATSGWIKMNLIIPDTQEPCDRVLVQLAYDDHPCLDTATFGRRPQREELAFALGDYAKSDNDCLDWGCTPIDKDIVEEVRSLVGPIGTQLAVGFDALTLGTIELQRNELKDELQFVAGSCQYPPGILDQKPGYAGYRRLAHDLNEGNLSPSFMVLMGDQIYVDATAGLFDPTSQDERFIQPYQRWLSTPAVRHVTRRLPLYSMLDDHEINDNWQPPVEGNEWEINDRYAIGLYGLFQRGSHIAVLRPDNGTKPRLWYTFHQQGFEFFMLDTRTEREPRNTANWDTAELLGTDQWAALVNWLEAGIDLARPRFIVSPALLLPRHRHLYDTKTNMDGNANVAGLRSDGWDGYPATMHGLLHLVASRRIKNLIFLSGDAHQAMSSEIQLFSPDRKLLSRVWSIHCSPLYAPFPFANTPQEEFAERDDFTFAGKDGERYRCTVVNKTTMAGDGFACMRLCHEDGWHLDCQFDRGRQEPKERHHWALD
ncbi:MAG: alpha/beta fold hydrolase [Pseudomonadota bacterium]